MSPPPKPQYQPQPIHLPSGQTITPNSEIYREAHAGEIPIIDISGIWSENFAVRRAVAEKGINPSYATAAFEQAEKFCALPLEAKLEVDTARVPGEYVGYHRLKGYNRNGRKESDLSEAFNWWVTSYQVDDAYFAEVALDNTFNTFLDALDDSYCNYTAYGITGDSLNTDPSTSITLATGYHHPRQFGAYRPDAQFHPARL
ncbi:hypothetical protein B0A50_03470 [Salinomyces thailandicus]|uniref:Non-haem dioxygenase N-terminal domain-containing protein n=1 Tax=Salinomyces thailandicus TaxID=706561 RepID=A0A4U0U3I6_9PEZI|nr:hypothetical protein B0A50_03470 [Salinomyces thailandica]